MLTADLILDNPILTKHIRARFRPAQFVPWLVVVGILCFVILSFCQVFDLFHNGGGLALVMGLQVILLGMAGASQVGTSIGATRASGMMDFHRISPVPPLVMAVGFFLGAPIREYALYAATLPLAVVLAAYSPPGIVGYLQLSITLLFGVWILHGVALLSSLVATRPKAKSGGGFGGLIVLALFLGQPIGYLVWYGSNELWGDAQSIMFFGLQIHWFFVLAAIEAVLLFWLFLAAVRKIRSEKAHAYTKPEAVVCLATLAILISGVVWNFVGYDAAPVVALYFLVLLGMILSITITPDQVEYTKGVRRAAHEGRRRPGAWSEAGSNRIALVCLCSIVGLTSIVAWEGLVPLAAGRPGNEQLGIAVGVFTVAAYGLSRQYFLMRMAKSGRTFLALFLFVVWLVPLMLGSAAALADNGRQYEVVLALSPIAGMAMASMERSEPNDVVRLAAITPPILLAFGANFLLVALQRRLDRIVHKAVKDREPKSPVVLESV